MYRGYKFRLILTKEQEEYCWKAANIARFFYNWAIAEKEKEYHRSGRSLSKYDLWRMSSILTDQSAYEWIREVHSEVRYGAIRDCEAAYRNMYKGICKRPKFKSKKKDTPSFCIKSAISVYDCNISCDSYKCRIYNPIHFYRDNNVKLAKLGKVKLAKGAIKYNFWYLTEHNIPIYNARISYDEKKWYISFTVDIPQQKKQLTDEVIGIDVGIKNTAICSNGEVYENINKTSKHIKKLKRRKRKLMKQINRKRKINILRNVDTEEISYIDTKNINKLKNKVKKIDRKLSNIRRTYNHQISRDIVDKCPQMIVMEHLNIKGMMKNKYMRDLLKNQALYQLKDFIKYKAENQGTTFIEAPRYFKSTQLCSKCGAVHKMSLSQRTYMCSVCGHVEDRDLNAAHNLKNYGLNLLHA